MENPHIERLVKESSAGNTVMFRELFQQVQRDVFRFIRIRVKNREDALDVLQDVFVDVWHALKHKKFVYTSTSEFYGFLYTIARRKISKLYRLRRPNVLLEDVGDIVDDAHHTQEENVSLIQAIHKLTPEDQEVLELRYFSGLTFGEIASLLKKGESAIKVRHHRAIQKIKHILGYEQEI